MPLLTSRQFETIAQNPATVRLQRKSIALDKRFRDKRTTTDKTCLYFAQDRVRCFFVAGFVRIRCDSVEGIRILTNPATLKLTTHSISSPCGEGPFRQTRTYFDNHPRLDPCIIRCRCPLRVITGLTQQQSVQVVFFPLLSGLRV